MTKLQQVIEQLGKLSQEELLGSLSFGQRILKQRLVRTRRQLARTRRQFRRLRRQPMEYQRLLAEYQRVTRYIHSLQEYPFPLKSRRVIRQIRELSPVDLQELISNVQVRVAKTPHDAPHLHADQAGRSIVKTPGVCGGDARLAHTRIPVWSLEQLRQLGASEQDILENFPGLTAADLGQAWAYADPHRSEIEQAIEAQEGA